MKGFSDLGGWGNYFIFSYLFMFCYTFLFFYGLFLRPVRMKELLLTLTRFSFTKNGEIMPSVLAMKYYWQAKN